MWSDRLLPQNVRMRIKSDIKHENFDCVAREMVNLTFIRSLLRTDITSAAVRGKIYYTRTSFTFDFN